MFRQREEEIFICIGHNHLKKVSIRKNKRWGLCSVEEDGGAGEVKADEENLGELVVTRGDGPEILELVEETLVRCVRSRARNRTGAGFFGWIWMG